MASAARPASARSLSGRTAHGPGSRRLVPSGSTLAASLPASSTIQRLHNNSTQNNLAHDDTHSSRTWTSTSGDVGLLNDADAVEDRSVFVLEYNRLAKKVGTLVLVLVARHVANSHTARHQTASCR